MSKDVSVGAMLRLAYYSCSGSFLLPRLVRAFRPVMSQGGGDGGWE